MNFIDKYSPCNELLRYSNGHLYWVKSGKGRVMNCPVGSKDKNGYIKVSVKGKQLLCHRVVWFILNGPIPPGMEIDHIDGDRSNNAIENLRICSRGENQRNMKIPITNTSGYKDVFINKDRGKPFRARVRFNNKRYHLGLFDTAEEADKAARKFRENFHAEFCRHK